MCFGDFNEILAAFEKRDGRRRPQRQMEGFQLAINICGFKDPGYTGLDFMWCSMEEGEDGIY